MARTKDRYLESRKQYQAFLTLMQYQAGAYTRLSNDSAAKGSESIENQEDMIRDYLKDHKEIKLVKVYKDDGFTGTNFHRSDFEMMMEDVRNGVINCIIVNDLSRFGREHIEVGDYLDKIFPFLGIRFISIRDHYDSLEPESEKRRLEISMKNLFHEIYPRDVSRNVSNVFYEMQGKGLSWSNAHAPYGYLVNREEKRYCFNYRTYKIVRKIAGWFIGGDTVETVLNKLFRRKILPPSIYRKTGKVYADRETPCKRWNPETVYKIMHNREYTGARITHKSEQRLYLNIKMHQVPEEEQFIFEDQHPAILRSDVFDRVQEAFKKISKRDRGETKSNKVLPMIDMVETNLLKGKVFCGNCHMPMNRIKNTKSIKKKKYQTRVYRCSAHLKDSRQCDTKSIRERDLFEIVLEALRARFQQISHLEEHLNILYQASFADVQQKCKWERNRVANQRVYLEQHRKQMFSAFLEGSVSKEKMEREKEQYELQRAHLDSQLEAAEKAEARIQYLKQYWCNMTREVMKYQPNVKKGKRLEYKELTEELIQTYIEEIRIYNEKRIEIIFSFHDELAETHLIFDRYAGERRAVS